jgi:serine/threonine-protein kinase Chk1
MEKSQRVPAHYMSFSQPATHIQSSDPSEHELRVSLPHSQKKGLFKDLFPSTNITRFSSHCEPQIVFQHLAAAFEQFVVPCKMIESYKMAFSTVDKRKCPLHGDITVQAVGNSFLVTFRKRKVVLFDIGRSSGVQAIV